MNRHFRTPSWTLAVVTACLLALVGHGSLAAQGTTTSGEIRGQATDPTGTPVAGATVVARNVDTGLTRGTTTGTEGQYAIRLLPPGTYTVEATALGRSPGRAANVRVTVGAATTANLAMAPVAVAIEGVVVSAGAGVDATEGGVRQLVGEETIDALPSLGRDFTSFIQLSPMVSPDPGETTGGKFSIGGMRASQTNVQIDGVDANNAFFGENRGGSRIPFVFSLESIREFQIVTNGYDVEFGRYSGGVVNAVTKGGTNEVDGSLYLNYRGDQLTSEDFLGNPAQDYEVTQFSGLLSGPIVQDKLFYLFSLDGQRRREPNIPISQGRFGPGGAQADPALFDDVGRFLTVLETQYGVENASNGYAPFQTSNDALTLFGRVDWNVNDAHRLSVRHNFSAFQNDNEWTERFDFIYGQSRAEEYRDVSHSFVSELQSVLGDNSFNVLRFQIANEHRPRNGKDLRPALVVNLSGGQQIGYGGTFTAFQNNLDEWKFQLIDNFTYAVNDHTFKLGGNALVTRFRNRFLQEGAGQYNFPSLDALEAFRPSSFRRNIRALGEVPEAEFGVADWAVYAQDEWQVTPRLSATFGLRYDLQRFSEDPGRVIDVERAFGIRTGIAPTDNDNVSARLSGAYDLFGSGRSVVRGGIGYFYGSVPGVLGGNVLQTERPVLALACAGEIAAGDADAPPDPRSFRDWSTTGNDNPFGCAEEAGLGGVPSYAFWMDDFEYPETLKANLGFEHALTDRTRASVDVLFSQSTKLYTVQNLNLRSTQFTLENEDGRAVFQPAAGFNPSATDPTANELRSRRNLDLGDVYRNTNNGRARSFIATLDLSHQLSGGTSFGASYSFTRAFDNSSFSCCTSNEGYEDATNVGAYGPNDLGDYGDTDRSWGASYFARTHSLVLSGRTELPLGIGVSAFWRVQSGRPWTPVVQGDLNGDGVRFNDRPFVYSPEELPLAVAGAAADEQRAQYADYLDRWSCVGEHVGQILPRNTCRVPSTNLLDLRLNKSLSTTRGQRAELQLDLFNVLNGLNSDWGQVMGIFAANTNLLRAVRYDTATNSVQYEVPTVFGQRGIVGENLLLQFQAQLGLKYYF